MRTFIAIEIPVGRALCNAIQEIRRSLSGESIKWVAQANLHLTLAFLGEIDDKMVGNLKVVLMLLEGTTPFSISVVGVGTFGSRLNPRVLWVGVEPSKELNELHGKLNAGLEPLGLVSDKRGFNPHITIGRINNVTNIASHEAVNRKFSNTNFQTTPVDRITLYKSDLTPQGPIYSPLVVQKF